MNGLFKRKLIHIITASYRILLYNSTLRRKRSNTQINKVATKKDKTFNRGIMLNLN